MKWIAAVLMIVNVVVYLWASGHQVTVDETQIISKPDVNKEGMLLLSENLKQFGAISNYPSDSEVVESAQELTKKIESEVESEVEPEVESKVESKVELKVESKIEPKVEPEVDSAPQIIAQSCYRLGPFKKQESWQSAQQWMGRNGIEFEQVTSKSRELQAVRVYLGPYNSISSAEPTVQQLKDKNLDHFVSSSEDGSVKISLGYFTQKELAIKFLTYLQSIDVLAESQLEYRQLGPFNWMVIAINSVEQNQVTTHDWAEQAVGLSQVDC